MHRAEDHQEVELGLLAAAVPRLALEQAEAGHEVAVEALAVTEAVLAVLLPQGSVESQGVAEQPIGLVGALAGQAADEPFRFRREPPLAAGDRDAAAGLALALDADNRAALFVAADPRNDLAVAADAVDLAMAVSRGRLRAGGQRASPSWLGLPARDIPNTQPSGASG